VCLRQLKPAVGTSLNRPAWCTLSPALTKAFRSFLRLLFRQDWVVYAKQPFGGPQHVLQYLARYTHSIAISNHRLLDLRDGMFSFRWKDYAHANKMRKMTISAEEFLRRFLLHTLPRGFVRHPLLRLPGQPRAGGFTTALSATFASRRATTQTDRGNLGLRPSIPLALSEMRRSDGSQRETHGSTDPT
jgi:hypothetical protein